MTILVSIISDQSLPNYLFIKEFQQEVDMFLFISTKQMEDKNKSTVLYETASISKNKCRKISVDENELYLIQKKLDNLGWQNDPEKEFLVNITGGTKLMSNAVFNYFSHLNSRFFYVPFGQNIYQELIPDNPVKKTPFDYEISLYEYLSIYGISYNESKEVISLKQCESVLYSFSKKAFVEDYFPYSAFGSGHRKLINLIGRWFENLVYHRICEELGLSKSQIGLNLELFDNIENSSIIQNDNEIDIAFIKNNRIYIIEAKSSIGYKNLNVTYLYNHFYKLAAVNQRFGLASKAFVISLTDIYTESPKRLENIAQRCKLLKLELPMDRSDIVDKTKFKKKLTKITK